MRLLTNRILMRAGIASCAIALVLAGCSDVRNSVENFERKFALPNISLEGSPNQTAIGLVDPNKETAKTQVGRNTIVAAFRASGCAKTAPDFEKMMRDQVGNGLSVPDGITLYDAGVGHYKSKTCGAGAKVRAIGAQANQKGIYVLRFFGGKVIRTLTVR